MSGNGDDTRSDIEKARESAGDSLNQTMVTGRRIIIDKDTGEIRLSEEPETKAPPQSATPEPANPPQAAESAEPAAPEPVTPVAPPQPEEPVMDRTVMQKAPVLPTKEAGQPSVAQGDPIDMTQTMTKANKRLSAETLFAFALPEPVINEAIEKAKREAGAPKKTDSAQKSGTNRLMFIVLGLLVAAVGGAGTFLWMQSENRSEVELPAKETPEPSAELEATASAPALPKATLPSGPVTAESAKSFSNEQLLTALKSGDLTTLSATIAEAATRKDPALIRQLVELGSHEDYLVRVSIVKSFSDKMYGDDTADAVLAMLLERLDDKDEIVRGFAAKAVGASGDKTALTKLRGRLDQEESDVVTKMLRAAIVELENAK